ncbi:DnaA ATPase domain-containing protein, partial [Patescibacteria group bacterium]
MLDSLNTNDKLWSQALVEIESEVSPANFKTWFKDININKNDNGTIFINVPSAFAKNWLSEKFDKLILKTLRELTENVRAVEYIVSSDKNPKSDSRRNNHTIINNELPLENFYISKEDNLNPRYTFDSFIVGSFNELAHAASQAILKHRKIVYNPLFVYGNTGYGKTHLTQAMGNYLKQGGDKKIFYITSEKFSMDCVNSIQQ